MSYSDGAKSTTRPVKIFFWLVGAAIVVALACFVVVPNWQKAHEPAPAPTRAAAVIPPPAPKPSPTPSATPTAKAKVAKAKSHKK